MLEALIRVCGRRIHLTDESLRRRDIYINTKSPPEQNINSKIENKEIGQEIRPLNEYPKTITVFDDVLGINIGQFFMRRKHISLDV